jgi:mono/diheme cytochrome c family protein
MSMMKTSLRLVFNLGRRSRLGAIWFGCVLALVSGLVAFAQSPKTSGDAEQDDLAAQGKKRFQAYKCYDCHGQNGEGTDDAPNLTHSKLTEEQVSKFLVKPSTDAQNKGMPDIPLDSPDHKPLVAYVMSLRAK